MSARHRDPDVLRRLYRGEGLTLREVADHLGVSKSAIHKWMDRHDIPRRTPPDDFRDRFWNKVDIGEPDECWEWNASAHPYGYGQFQPGDRSRRPMRAHRIAYELQKGRIDGECVLHKCDNPPCVNPNHLFTGSHADNVRDKVEKGRDPVGSESHNAKLTESDAVDIVERYERGGVTIKELAEDHGVERSTASSVLSGKNWSHATGVEE